MANQSSIQFNNYYIFAGRIKVSATFFFLSRNMSVLFDELTIYKNEEYYGKRERVNIEYSWHAQSHSHI